MMMIIMESEESCSNTNSKSHSYSSHDGPLVLAVNGERFDLPFFDPSTTLLHFLRLHTRFKSVKLSCGEGGCGACVVLLSRYDPATGQVEDFAVSSCLTLLYSVHGCSVTTSEGLGNLRDGFHPIHERIAGFHATQCGFCTPGMCVSLFSAMVNAEKTNGPDPPPGFSKLTVAGAEKAVSGNLCRCTGYRSIADACKSFAADVDIEDLGFNSFWGKGESKEVMSSSLPFYNRAKKICTFPEFLKKGVPLDLKAWSWFSPRTVEELKGILNHSHVSGNAIRTKLVVGNTGTGYYKDVEKYDRYIDLKYMNELSMIRVDDSGFEIGAAVTISKVIEALKSYGSAMVFHKLANHMEKLASGFIRNTASFGGNLVMAQSRRFPSDLATILLAVDATVEVMTGSGREKLTLEEFLDRPSLDSKGVVLSIKIPNWESATGSNLSRRDDTLLLFETYRASPRPLGNALPYLNAAFMAEVSPCGTSKGVSVNSCRLAFGAYGTSHAIRARKVEEFLTGKVLNPQVLYEATKLVRAIVVPEDGTKSPAYRSSLAVGFLFKFFSPFIEITTENTLGEFIDRSGREKVLQPLLSSGKQVIGSSKEYHPVGKPITKSGATIQASGEAVYVDDIPSPTNCLYGSFIYSTEPFARVNGITSVPSDRPNGVVKIFTFRDIPEVGENVGSKTIFGTEPLFSDDFTQCAGQRVALVVADSQKHADLAANLAVVEYGVEDLPPPILTVEEAFTRSSFFDVPPFLAPKHVGDTTKGMAEADHKIISAEFKLGSQYYFYMETQTALAVPDEDNCMVVYSSSQCPEYAHGVIAKCLGVPEHNVRVLTRRVGGGFGGKAIKSMPVATACALAAHKLQRPIRMYVNRKTDMIMAGGRHPMKITYSIGFKSNGKITALELQILINAGFSPDISLMLPANMMGALKKYDWGALSFDIKVCKTNHSSKSAMRGPGEVQGSFIAEAIIEHVASFLSMEVDSVRQRNLHTIESLNRFYGLGEEAPLYTLPSIWDKLALSSSFDRRTQLVGEFNMRNKWVKRGISRVPIVIQLLLRPTPGKVSILLDGSVTVEVGGIELGQGLWTKVKQVAAFALSLIGCDSTLEYLLDKVRVVQTDTLSLIQGGFTAGSTTSEASCEAVRLCCNTLVERLTPLKESLEKQNGPVKWDTLIAEGYMQAVNFSASALYVPDYSSMRYLNYGAAVSEVEINLLTGETKILQVDIIYDCGQSLNPAVDLGQIEGAFVQGIGFFMLEEYLTDSKGLIVSDSTWTYKIPSLDTIPKQFNVEIINSGHHKKRVLSSKASGEPPLLLASSVHCAARAAVREARKQLLSWSSNADEPDPIFQMEVPATMPIVKELCGLDIVERYLEWTIGRKNSL